MPPRDERPGVGPPGDGRRREGVAGFLLVVLCLGVLSVLVARGEGDRALGIVGREAAALAAVDRLAQAERRFHAARGTYGWIQDLEAEGLLGDLPVGTRDGRRVVLPAGYRLDVLLPLNAVRIVPSGGAAPDAELARRHFAVVARPTEPGVTGYRIWYLDERRDLYAAEGLVDGTLRERNPLPDGPAFATGPGAATSRIAWTLVRPASSDPSLTR